MKTTMFVSFGKDQTGKVITSFRVCGNEYAVVSSRNPYGSHSLVMCEHTWTYPDGTKEYTAFRHGNAAVLFFVSQYSKKALKKVVSYLLGKGCIGNLVKSR